MYLHHCAVAGTLATYCFCSLLVIFFRYLRRPVRPPTTQQDNPLSTTDSPNVTDLSNTTTSKLYALIIGINYYYNLPNLGGAVRDADSMSEFLIDDLGVPPSHITNLRDSSATRAGIIRAFQALRDDPRIKHGFPILIYFAGHGGEAEPAEWKERYGVISKVQVIFPYDYGMEFDGGKVNCIPDKTVARLLNGLAKAKGDNITVFFDSCHSASGSRVATGTQARSAAVNLPIPANIDDDILSSALFSPSTASTLVSARNAHLPLCTHQSSHIHFAACGSNEQAWEEDGQGEFTTALLKKIRVCGVDKITYQNLISELPWLSKQTPHCYGANKSRILFNACVPSRKIAYIPALYDPARHTLALQAGAASGVTEDSVWEVRVSTSEGDKSIVGTAKTGVPRVSNAALMPEDGEDRDLFWSRCEAGKRWQDGKKKLYARQIKSGRGNELRVWFSPEVKRLVFPELESNVPKNHIRRGYEVGYVVHPERDSADIAVEVYQPAVPKEGHHPDSVSASVDGPDAEPEVVFHLCDPQVEKYGIAALRRRKPARRAEVETVLFAAARWNWHLKRMNPTQTHALVEVEMFKIAEKHLIDDEHSVYEWNLVGEERKNLNEMGLVNIEVHEKDLYAVRLKSWAKVPLYVQAFYFDTTEFAIAQQFGHSVYSPQSDPTIPARGEFIIGDGGEGEAPLAYKIDPGEAFDVGYMKIFWSTDPLELSYVAQESAFEMKVGAQSRRPGARPTSQGSEWGSVLLTLVQRAPMCGTM